MHLFTRVENLLFLVKRKRFGTIYRKLKHRFYSDNKSYGLRRDLSLPFSPRNAKIPLTVRPLQEGDIPKIFDFDNPKYSEQYRRDLIYRIEHLKANIPTCYVAVTDDNIPVYMQWLMRHTENKKIQAHFNGIFPRLEPDEVLLENALTPEVYRNLGIRGYAMGQIAANGRKYGARWAITFVAVQNTPSLKGAKQAGFVPFLIRHEKWFFFVRTLTFIKLPPCTPYPFETVEPEAAAVHN